MDAKIFLSVQCLKTTMVNQLVIPLHIIFIQLFQPWVFFLLSGIFLPIHHRLTTIQGLIIFVFIAMASSTCRQILRGHPRCFQTYFSIRAGEFLDRCSCSKKWPSIFATPIVNHTLYRSSLFFRKSLLSFFYHHMADINSTYTLKFCYQSSRYERTTGH